jgi:hypothetical protein
VTLQHRGWTAARNVAAVGAALALGAALLAVTSPAQGVNTTRTGPRDARGFPTYYTDDSGLSVQLCDDGTARCELVGRRDLRPPDGEAVYWAALATLNTRGGGELEVELALEAAFGDAGEPIVVDLLRVRGHLPRAGSYVLRHPFGAQRIFAGRPREDRNVNTVEETGCSLRRGGRCEGLVANFLRSKPATRGYLGGGETESRVTGGTRRNRLVLLRRGRVVGRTNQFAVMGKVAPGPTAALSRTSVRMGNTARVRDTTVVVRNLGNEALDFTRIRMRGADTIRIRRSTCRAARTVAPGRACRIHVRYRPGARRQSSARLAIRDNTLAGFHRVPIRAATTPVLAVRHRVHFARRAVGTASRSRRIIVENRGVAPLRIKRVSLRGRHERSFDRRSGDGPLCTNGRRLRPGGVCAVYVAFEPKVFGRKRASIVLRSNALSSPHRIRLSGRGR